MPTGPEKQTKRPTARVEAADDISRHACRRIRELRQKNGWSLDVLSRASGVSRSMLSQIEREQANPTLAVTVRIAAALGLTMAELVEQPEPKSSVRVIRGADPGYLYRQDDQCSIRTLSPLQLEKDVEFYEVRLSSAGTLRSAAHFQGTREFLTVQKGSVRILSGTDDGVLQKGDSAEYPADVPHEITNTGRGEAVFFLVVIYR